MQETMLLDLVDSIYEAAVDPEKTTAFLAKLNRALQCPASELLAHDSSALRASIAASVGLDEACLQRYRQYAAQDPFMARGRAYMVPGTVFTGSMIVPDEELVRTEFYNLYMRPSDLHHLIGGTITSDAWGAALIASYRPERQGPFEKAELEIYRTLDPHLRRSLDLQRRLAAQDGQREALDKIASGCVLLGRNGRVLAINQAAERIFARRDGILYRNGRLETYVPDTSARLRDLIRSVTVAHGYAAAGGMMAVYRTCTFQPYTVMVAPLGRTPVDWGGYFPVAALFICDPACAPVTEDALAQLYRLTPAEARLARALSNGEGLGQAAAQLAIGINTAKTHLQRIFAKTQTCRQAELVRLLAGVAAMSTLQTQERAAAQAPKLHGGAGGKMSGV